MNWEALAAVGELLGAAGVIVSLVYLATQVRASSLQAQHAAGQAVLGKINSVLENVSQNVQLADVYTRGLKGLDQLTSEAELLQFSATLSSGFRPYEELYYYHKDGKVDEWTWNTVVAMLGAQASSPGFVEWWALRAPFFSQEFQEYLESTLPETPRNALLDYAEAREEWSDDHRAS